MGKPKAYVNQKLCLSCSGCVSVCPQNAIHLENLIAYINPSKCTACMICINTCSVGAITLLEE